MVFRIKPSESSDLVWPGLSRLGVALSMSKASRNKSTECRKFSRLHVRVSALASLIMQVGFAEKQGSQAGNVHGLRLMSHHSRGNP